MSMIPVVLAAIALASCVAVAPLAAAPPLPGSGAVPDPPQVGTGFDLAVVGIETLGPNDPCVYCPVIEVKNVGIKQVRGTFKYQFHSDRSVGGDIFREIVLSLAPGMSKKIPPHMPLDQNFARYEDTVTATIDVDKRLKEDNETNNALTKKLERPRQPAERPK